jgi:copper(I)-binding protein
VSRPVTAVLLSAALLSACGTGLEAQTYKPRTPHDSISAHVGKVAIRNLAIAAPQQGQTLAVGDRAVVTGSFINEDTVPDALVDASSDIAATVVLQTDGQDPTIPIPPLGSSGTTWSLVLDGLTKELRPGQFASLTLVFAKAGRITVSVPVRAGDTGLGERKAEQDPYAG